MSGPSAFSTDNDTGPTVISETVVISKSEESPGSKYSKQDPRNSSGLTVDTDLSARVRQGSSVSVELSARPERSVGDLVMEDRGHRSLPGMVSPPTLTLQPRVAQARPQPPALPPPPPLLKIPSVDHPTSIPSSSSGKILCRIKHLDLRLCQYYFSRTLIIAIPSAPDPYPGEI